MVSERLKDCFPVTQEEFLQTVDKWMGMALYGESEIPCGFCDASREEFRDCSRCPCSIVNICNSDNMDACYDRWVYLRSYSPVAKQIAMEILEKLYDLAKEMGYYGDFAKAGWQ